MKPSSILLFLGALLIAVGVLTSHWFGTSYHSEYSGEDMSFHGGLYSVVECHGDSCDTTLMLKYLGKGALENTLGVLVGALTLVVGLGTVVVAGIAGAANLGGRRGIVMFGMIAGIVSLFLGIAYLGLTHGLTHPGDWGFSVFVFIIGGGLVIAGAVIGMSAFPAAPRMMMMYPQGMMPGMPGMPGVPMQGFAPQPMQGFAPQPMQGFAPQPMMPQAAPPQPSCNVCGGPTVWNGQVGKLFCVPCNRFLV